MEVTLPSNASLSVPRKLFRRRLSPSGYPYVLVALAYMGIFILYPMVRTIWESFTNTSLLNPTGGSFIGLTNYKELISSGNLGQSLYVTIGYVFVTVTVSMVLGVTCALLVERVSVGKSVVRTLLGLPWAVPAIATGILFTIILDPKVGILNYLLGRVGISPVPWLTNNTIAFWAVCMVTIWTLCPFVILVAVAAIQGVQRELYDAALVDGASAWMTARHVTLPGIAPILRVVAVLQVIWAFQQFQLAYVLTGGGPINGTNFVVVNLYHTAFDDQQLGSASAIGVVGLLLAGVFVAAYFVVERRASRMG